jgi:magnesium and cobalt exporter, CNNM family
MIWLTVACCLLASFVFSGIEAGILSVNRVRLKHRVRQRDRAALKLERLLADPERILVTVLIITNLANISAVTLSTRELVTYYGYYGYVIALAVFVPVYLLGVELLPKSLFRRFPYRALAMLAEPLRLVDAALTPLHWLVSKIGRHAGRKEEAAQKLFVAREDFKYLTIETERAGSLTPVEREMIHGVVDFRSVTAHDVMVSASDIEIIDGRSDLADLIASAQRSGKNRWPVRGESGAFTGIVTLLDVALSGRRSGPVSSVQRRIVKLSPNEPAYTVLHKLRAARSLMGAVIEDGKPIGVVTWEDVIMRLVKAAAGKPESERQSKASS